MIIRVGKRELDAISCAPFVDTNQPVSRSQKEPKAIFKKTIVSRFFILPIVLLLGLLAGPVDAQRRQASNESPSTTGQSDALKVLQWRQIGPFRGGRSTAVAGVASQPMVFYFGGTGGGVWKTIDGGINWQAVSDGSVFGTGSVGAIGLSDS